MSWVGKEHSQLPYTALQTMPSGKAKSRCYEVQKVLTTIAIKKYSAQLKGWCRYHACCVQRCPFLVWPVTDTTEGYQGCLGSVLAAHVPMHTHTHMQGSACCGSGVFDREPSAVNVKPTPWTLPGRAQTTATLPSSSGGEIDYHEWTISSGPETSTTCEHGAAWRMNMRARVFVCVCARARACVCACARVCVRARIL